MYFLAYPYKIYRINSSPSLANKNLFIRRARRRKLFGKKDAVSKHYMSKNEIFADAINFYFFDGKEKVKPEDLEELDSSELVLPYGKSTEQKSTKGDSVQGRAALSVPVQKYRDILKRCVIRRCRKPYI